MKPKNLKRINKGTREAPKEGDFTFNIPQSELAGIEVFAPISVKQELYLNDQHNDIIVWGGAAGAGKTQVSLLFVKLNALFDKDYVGAIARKSQKQMKSAGSLWSTGTKMLAPLGVSANSLELHWRFPNGSEVKCHHLDRNPDDWQGTQATTFLVDEAQQCSEDDVWYLTSRMRSRSKKKHQLRLTCNPDADSFLKDWLVKGGYLLESGLPNKEMDGVTTHMVVVGGEFHWFKTIREIEERFGKEVAKYSRKFAFYSANVYDNPFIRRNIPEYVYQLENLKGVERERLLLGNWFTRLQGVGYIERDWFKPINRSEVDLTLPFIRCWDLASTKPSQVNPNPDYTRGVKCSYDKETGEFFIHDLASCRDRPAVVQSLIENTATMDGRDCYIGIPIDAGASGRTVADTKRARLTQMGHKVVLVPARKSKLERAEPFLIALQQGKVHLVNDVFKDEHFKELENFDGGKNNGWHDDIIDCLADCYNQLTTGHLIPTIRINNNRNLLNTRRVGGSTLLT